MLVLSRKREQVIVLGHRAEIVIKILGVQNGYVRVGIQADPQIPIHREEIYQRIQQGECVV